MIRNDFAVFILSHGRADNVITKKTLDSLGYSGSWYIVIDNEDKQSDLYYRNFGHDHVIMFDKAAEAQWMDAADLSEKRNTVFYARNICFKLAEKLGIRFFLELDDDYNNFMFRYAEGKKLQWKQFSDLDLLFEAMLDFLEISGAHSVALCQGGDFIGGVGNSRFHAGLIRKAMNTFFCDVSRPFQFRGRINEDVSTYTCEANKGKLFFSVTCAMVNQAQTQKQAGGMTDIYLDTGTYVKSFYTIIHSPQAVKISSMNSNHARIHHLIDYNHCCPKILSEKYRKAE